MKVPDDLRYTKDHEWVKLEGKVATVGITDHAQGSLGDIVYVELPAEGEAVTKDETFGVVESVKAVSDCYAPLTGKVSEINSPLSESPETINEDPYGEGWMIRIELSNPKELEGLMSPGEYTQLISEETA
jgi:glycine cleavage system H protein